MMKIGLVGLGKMGYNLALNMKRNGHTVIGYDVDPHALSRMNSVGIDTAATLPELLNKLDDVKIVWMMIPAGMQVELTLSKLKPLMSAGDIVVEGGNSFYKDTIKRASEFNDLGIHYLDCGTSGGTEGALNGICAMVGGSEDAFKALEPVFQAISLPGALLYCGSSGSGHYVKMVHNGIEYGMMQAIAEGFELLHKSDMDLNLRSIAGLWNHGSVVRGWLMELTEKALAKEADLSSIKGVMHSSGEGKWALETALDKQIATPALAMAVLMRYRSLEDDTFSGKVVAALRNEFGGHEVESR